MIKGTKAPARSLGALTTHCDREIILRDPAASAGARRRRPGAFAGKGFPWPQRSRTLTTWDKLPFRCGSTRSPYGGGAGLLVGIVVAAMFVELPVLGWTLGPAIAAGLVFGVGLIVWRRR